MPLLPFLMLSASLLVPPAFHAAMASPVEGEVISGCGFLPVHPMDVDLEGQVLVVVDDATACPAQGQAWVESKGGRVVDVVLLDARGDVDCVRRQLLKRTMGDRYALVTFGA